MNQYNIVKVNTKKIAYYGVGYKDFAVYMAFILNNMGYTILMKDNSSNRELADIMSCSDLDHGIITYRNVDFSFSGDICEGYDYVISYFSEYSDALLKDGDRCIVINTGIYKSQLEVCRRIIEETAGDVIVVLRDVAGNVIDRRYLSRHFMNTAGLLGFFQIRLDMYDKEYQYRMDYDGIGRLPLISEDYMKALAKSVSALTGRERGNVKKALKHLKEGRIFDNRLLE